MIVKIFVGFAAAAWRRPRLLCMGRRARRGPVSIQELRHCHSINGRARRRRRTWASGRGGVQPDFTGGDAMEPRAAHVGALSKASTKVELSAQDSADLFAYFYAARYMDPRRRGRGKRLFAPSAALSATPRGTDAKASSPACNGSRCGSDRVVAADVEPCPGDARGDGEEGTRASDADGYGNERHPRLSPFAAAARATSPYSSPPRRRPGRCCSRSRAAPTATKAPAAWDKLASFGSVSEVGRRLSGIPRWTR